MGQDVRARGHGDHTCWSKGTEIGEYKVSFVFSCPVSSSPILEYPLALYSKACRFTSELLRAGRKLIDNRP